MRRTSNSGIALPKASGEGSRAPAQEEGSKAPLFQHAELPIGSRDVILLFLRRPHVEPNARAVGLGDDSAVTLTASAPQPGVGGQVSRGEPSGDQNDACQPKNQLGAFHKHFISG
jgi:hypothetical protein